jgi:hypothetical protein
MPRHATLRATPLFVDAIIDAAFFHADTPPMPLSLILIAEDAALPLFSFAIADRFQPTLFSF